MKISKASPCFLAGCANELWVGGGEAGFEWCRTTSHWDAEDALFPFSLNSPLIPLKDVLLECIHLTACFGALAPDELHLAECETHTNKSDEL